MAAKVYDYFLIFSDCNKWYRFVQKCSIGIRKKVYSTFYANNYPIIINVCIRISSHDARTGHEAHVNFSPVIYFHLLYLQWTLSSLKILLFNVYICNIVFYYVYVYIRFYVSINISYFLHFYILFLTIQKICNILYAVCSEVIYKNPLHHLT